MERDHRQYELNVSRETLEKGGNIMCLYPRNKYEHLYYNLRMAWASCEWSRMKIQENYTANSMTIVCARYEKEITYDEFRKLTTFNTKQFLLLSQAIDDIGYKGGDN